MIIIIIIVITKQDTTGQLLEVRYSLIEYIIYFFYFTKRPPYHERQRLILIAQTIRDTNRMINIGDNWRRGSKVLPLYIVIPNQHYYHG